MWRSNPRRRARNCPLISLTAPSACPLVCGSYGTDPSLEADSTPADRLSAATVFADLFYHKHGHWHFQEIMGFDAFYGFVACVGLVIAAKGLRVLLMRDEDYYD